MLEIKDLTVRFGDTLAVDDVSLDLEAGQVLAVLGPSGCGKSTLLRAVAGLEPSYAGRIAYDGQDLAGVPTHRRGFALMFQDGQLFPHQSVARNVGYPLRLRARRPAASRRSRWPTCSTWSGCPPRRPDADHALRRRAAARRPRPGPGRRAAAAAARRAAQRPRRRRCASAWPASCATSCAGHGTTALLVTHDHEEAFAVADRMAVMRAGRVVQSGTLDEVWRHPVDSATAVFLGYPTVVVRRRRGAAGRGSRRLRRLAGGRAATLGAAGRRGRPGHRDVLAARVTPEQLRLSVAVEGVGERRGRRRTRRRARRSGNGSGWPWTPVGSPCWPPAEHPDDPGHGQISSRRRLLDSSS